MTSQPLRDPAADELLTPQNSALVVIDYQLSQVQTVHSIDRELLIKNIVRRPASEDLQPAGCAVYHQCRWRSGPDGP